MNLRGKRLLVHPHFALYLVTPLPLKMLQSKIVSTAIVIDFTPYKSQLLGGLRGNTDSSGQVKGLLDDYHRRSAAMIKALSQLQEASFTVDVIQDEMQALLQVRTQPLTVNDVSNWQNVCTFDCTKVFSRYPLRKGACEPHGVLLLPLV